MRQSHPLSTHLALFAAGIGVPLLLLALLVGWGSLGRSGPASTARPSASSAASSVTSSASSPL